MLKSSGSSLPQAALVYSASSYTLDWIAPILFGLLFYIVVLFHSPSWLTTLPEVVIFTIGASGIVLVLTHARERLRMPRIIAVWLLLLGISTAISIWHSWDASISLPRLLLYASIALFASAMYALHRDAGYIPVSSYCIVIALVQVPFVVAVIREFVDANGHFFPNGPHVVNFGNVRHFGHVCFLAAVSATAAFVLSRKRTMAVLSFALTCCALFAIIAVASRGPLLAWIFFMGFLLCITTERRRLAVFGLTALISTSALVWYLNFSGLLLTPHIFARVQMQLADGGQAMDSGRLQLWLAAIHEIAAHPWFGRGPEAYELSGCCDRWLTHPHNFVLQLLMEFGVVGCSILVMLLLSVMRLMGGAPALASRLAGTSENRVLTSMLLAHVALGLIDGMLYFAVPLIYFGLFSGLLAAGLRQGADRMVRSV